MKFVKQCKDTFQRSYEDFIYIKNQLTKQDRIYDYIGKIFLENINREPCLIEETLDNIYTFFDNIEKETITSDFIDFVKDLEDNKYVVTGETVEELNKNEPSFSYSIKNVETSINLFDNKEHLNYRSDFFLNYFYRKRKNSTSTIPKATIEVTSKCNERCVHCYIPHKFKNKDMNKNDIFLFIDQLHDMNGVDLILSGGECFLHKDILEIIKYAHKKDFIISILSNATLIDDSIISVIKEANINIFQVSIYSMKPEIHDYITQLRGSHKKTIHNIIKMIEADIPVRISCPVMKINRKDYKDVIMWANKYKIKAYTDYIMIGKMNLDISNLQNRISIQEAEELIKDILAVDLDYNNIIDKIPYIDKTSSISGNEEYKTKPICGAGFDKIYLSSDGNLYPCPGWQYKLGNITEQSLKDIWENSPKLKYIRGITKESFPKCLECEAKDYCVICMERNFNESNGNIFKINEYYCKVAFINKKLVENYKKINRVLS